MTDAFAMARARSALAGAGLEMERPLTRAASVTNEVWISDEVVVRVNRQPNQRLRREALLGPSLPPEVGYPEIVAYGGRLGADWLVVRRVTGTPLSRWWPAMRVAERRRAIGQLASMLSSLHRTACPDGLPLLDTPQPLGSRRAGERPVDPLLRALDHARHLPHVDRLVIDEAAAIVRSTGGAIEPFDVPTLVHGDLTFENVLWDGAGVSCLLDFEWSRPAPPDLDLDVLLRFCAYPFLHVAPDYEELARPEDYEPVPRWLAEDYPELFSSPALAGRLRLYSIAYDVRELLAFPPQRPARQLSRHHPHNRLASTVETGGHLRMWDSMASTSSGESGVTAGL